MYKRIFMISFISLFVTAVSSAQNDAGVKQLFLEEVSALALQNNFDIQLTKYDIQISRQDIDIARSVYDSIFTAEAEYTDDKSAKNSTLLADHSTSRDFSVGVSKSFSSGTEVSVEHVNSRGWRIPASNVTYNPDYNSSVSLTVEQDLGKNFFGLQGRGNVKVAMKDVENATHLSLDKIEQTLADVQKSYWALVRAEDLYEIEQEFLEQAKRLHEIDKERIKHGLIEKPQLLGSEANYHERWGEISVAKNNLKTRENILKLQLNISEERGVVLMPAEEFQLEKAGVSLKQSLENAFKFRRDYKKAMNEIKRRDILLSMKKNGLWPEINLEASFTRNGLDDGYGGSAGKIIDEDNPEFFTSLSVSVPLENRDAKAKLKQAEFEKAKALLDAKYLERKIAIEIVDQARECEIFYERLVSLKKAADLQTQKAAAQEKIFNQGRSDSDVVIRYQEDALAARVRAVNAFYEYYEALIDLKKKEGSLLVEHWDGEI